MHILLIHQYFLEDHEPGGSRWNEMARIWVGAGHRVTVLAGTGHYMNFPRKKSANRIEISMNANGVKVIRCHVLHGNQSFAGRLFGYLSFVFSSIWAGLFYAPKKYDLILVTSPPLFTGITALFLSRVKKIPFLLEVRDLWPESAIETGVLTNKNLIRLSHWFEQKLYKTARLINVVTPAFKDILIKQKNVQNGKIIFIPNAADFSLSDRALMHFDREKFRRELGLHDQFIIIYVGAHGIANHLVQLIDAAEKLKETNAFFLLIGDGAKKGELENEAANRGLQNILFMDPVPKMEVFKYISAADIGTSVLKKTDIFKTVYSNKTFDYFSCKKPVLMAIDGVSRQLVESANAGLYAEPENVADFVAKVIVFMDNPELIKKHGENGYRYAKAHFDRDVLAKEYLKYISELVSK
ncbi:glycosyltransferase family 4 protein [Dyadobacter sp. CY323]|uniref:glycosyltransferase family 4 protein n=1 Tax=Dyadobacter sp. CY323 TaxID=2907302 RepID=UPI001F18C781|nr:glycosyltransferase family 4 protein [Dyadobacter sp. CY323]MCE6988975.1 glycosyltransferase family 4 protein [Dyadobacter sp. CY323]